MPKIYTLHHMGNRNGDLSREMHHVLYRTNMGWNEYIKRHVMPDLEWGADGVMFHLPFGTTDGYMSFDSWPIAQERNLTLIYEEFRDALYTLWQTGTKIICYMGSLSLNFNAPNTYLGWINRYLDSIDPFIDAGLPIAAIAYDTAGTWAKDSKEHAAAVLTDEEMHFEVYIEGTERIRRPDGTPPGRWERGFSKHWRGFNVTANHGHYWTNMTKQRHPDVQWDSIKHYDQFVPMITGHDKPASYGVATPRSTFNLWGPSMISQDWMAGFVPAAPITWLRDHQITREALERMV